MSEEKEIQHIDKEVLERANDAGLDVLGIIDRVKETIKPQQTGHLKYDIVEAKEGFLQSIQRSIKRANAKPVEIGKVTNPNSSRLRHYTYGKIMLSQDSLIDLNADHTKPSIESFSLLDVLDNLYPVDKIIENYLLVLIEAIEQNKDEIRELEFKTEVVNGIDSIYGALTW